MGETMSSCGDCCKKGETGVTHLNPTNDDIINLRKSEAMMTKDGHIEGNAYINGR